MPYELYYWPGIQGRGEFVRLALEEAGADYVDVARGRGPGRGVEAMTALMRERPFAPFAPPFVRDGEVVVSHVAKSSAGSARNSASRRRTSAPPVRPGTPTDDHGLRRRSPRHPPSHLDRPLLRGPEGGGQGARNAFLDHRVPKYLGYFERALADQPAGPAHAVGDGLTTVDLSLFQIWAGMRYAFPHAFAGANALSELAALVSAVASAPTSPAISPPNGGCLSNEQGIFRRDPELDQPAGRDGADVSRTSRQPVASRLSSCPPSREAAVATKPALKLGPAAPTTVARFSGTFSVVFIFLNFFALDAPRACPAIRGSAGKHAMGGRKCVTTRSTCK